MKKLTALFDACFRIQREAIGAAGHFIPMVVEECARGADRPVQRLKDAPIDGFKSQGMNWSDRSKHGQDFTRIAAGWRAKHYAETAKAALAEGGFTQNGQPLGKNQLGRKHGSKSRLCHHCEDTAAVSEMDRQDLETKRIY